MSACKLEFNPADMSQTTHDLEMRNLTGMFSNIKLRLNLKKRITNLQGGANESSLKCNIFLQQSG